MIVVGIVTFVSPKILASASSPINVEPVFTKAWAVAKVPLKMGFSVRFSV